MDMARSHNEREHFSIRRTMKYTPTTSNHLQQYINTAVTSASHNQSDIRISFGCTDLRNNGMRILEYLGESFVEVCQKEFNDIVNQCQWIPSHPQLLAIATDEMNIYELQNKELSLRSSLLPKGNPVIFMDWNRLDPEVILATRQDGKLILMNIKYDNTDGNQCSFFDLPAPSCGARFGTKNMKKCFITASKNHQVQILNEKFKVIKSYKFTHDILGIEFSSNSEHVAFRKKKAVCVYDVRNLNRELKTYSTALSKQLPTCFCWSPRFSALYIGTSEGEINKCWFNTATVEKCTNEKRKKIPDIHLPETMDNLFFATSVDFPYEPHATSIEAYSCVSSL